MSRCTYRPASTRCGFRAEPGHPFCRRCQRLARAERIRFDDWMQRVMWTMETEYGLHPEDLPGCPYADWHTSGMDPEEAAICAVERGLGD